MFPPTKCLDIFPPVEWMLLTEGVDAFIFFLKAALYIVRNFMLALDVFGAV